MTGIAFANYVRYLTKTNATTLPLSEIALLANAELFDLMADADRSNEQIFGAIALDDLRANTREYPFPADILTKIIKVEAKLNGTDWVALDEFDLNSYKRTTDEAKIVELFGNIDTGIDALNTGYSNVRKPAFDIYRNAIFIYSGAVEAVAGGLKLYYSQEPTELDDTRLGSSTDLSAPPTDTQTGIPKALHKTLAIRTSIAWKSAKQRPIPLTETEQNIEYIQSKAIDSLRGTNLDRTIIAQVPYNDGSQY